MVVGDFSGSSPPAALRPRLLFVMWAVGLALVVLIVRLYTLQVMRGEELTREGRRNFVQRVRVPHDRGIIYDRFGRILADNRPSLDVQVTPAFLGKRADAAVNLRELAELLALSERELAWAVREVSAQTGLDAFRPLTIKRDLSPEQVEAVESRRALFELDGVEIVEGRRRAYPNGTRAAHLLGYVKEIDGPELDAARAGDNPLRYELGDFIGRDGIERSEEKALRGTDGYAKVVVDAKGRRQDDAYVRQLLRDEPRSEPRPGHNVFLTLDLDLQAVAESAFTGRAGAVVALDVRTGAVLALASFPMFDPNLVSGLLAQEEKAKLDNDPLKPWLSRSIQGQYPPGSTFKAVTALTALSDRATSPREKVHCPGWFRMGRQTWRCHVDRGHGHVPLTRAIAVSCDTYFYTMGGRLGIDKMAGMAHALGLGRRTGIALANEQPGLVPTEAHHDHVNAATGGYQRGMAINTAIGQGDLLVTPMQLAVAYATIANNGTVLVPQVVDHVETADFRLVRRYLPRAAPAEPTGGGVREEVMGVGPELVRKSEVQARPIEGISPEHIQTVREGLLAVAQEPFGTAYWHRSRKVTIAGKTGTSQVIRLGRARLKSEELQYEERDHAWFVAYAPAAAPEIVVSVLNEHSGHGSTHAAPVAVKVIDAYMALQAQRLASAVQAVRGDSP
ncbi:MAG: penicillin-binding protein 2 [Deltaproteobacteria bacterium]|nr:penicillin-binding protein 2 [Deltaproteobacteria bacterium]